jgi:hypothetical protein
MFEKLVQSPHGMGEITAVFETSTASYGTSTNTNYDYRIIEGVADENKHTTVSTYNNINYEMYYWISAKSRDAFLADPTSNNKPILWVDADSGYTLLSGSDLDESYDGLSTELKAEKHCEEVILA